MENCAICGVQSKQKCSGCNVAFYCSRDHQVADWKRGHKKNCKCYDVESNEILGRYMIAKRDIKPGDLILREKPIIIGPKTTSYVMCLGCHQMLTPSAKNSFYKCSKCSWPLCGKKCETSENHIDECKLMHEKNFTANIGNSGAMKIESGYCVIVPLRAIILKRKDPKLFEKFSKLVSHIDQRISTKLYDVLRINLVPFILNCLQIPDTTEQEILNIAGILDTNTFELLLSSKKIKARGIYFETAMMAHECIPNTKHFVDENLEMRVIATMAIKKGEKILTSYSHPLKTTIERRLAIKISKCFDCICPRCCDPEELKTFASTIKCSACKNGLLESCDPLNNVSSWKCTGCDEKIPGMKVIQTVNEIRKRLENLNKRSIEACEKFLNEYDNLLPGSSVFMIDVKYALCMLYGNVDGYFLNDLPIDKIQRKLELCTELITQLSVLEPGISNSVLNAKFELEVARILLLKRQPASKGEAFEEINKHMQNITEIYGLLVAASDGKSLLDNRLQKVKELIEF